MSTTFRLPEQRDHLLVLAQLAEQTERYDEMVVCLRRAAKLAPDFSHDERQMLAVAYKHIVTARRASWRVACSIEQVEERQRSAQVPVARNYRRQIEAEITEICNNFIAFLDRLMIPAAPSEEARVFFFKLKGDYHRYLAEISQGEDDKEKAHNSYTKAMEYAAGLRAASPLRLGLALNFSIFYYEVLKSPDKACHLARQTYEEGIADDDDLEELERRESALLLQLLRENIYVWTEHDDVMAD
jgi:14-3-3 protein epsilon